MPSRNCTVQVQLMVKYITSLTWVEKKTNKEKHHYACVKKFSVARYNGMCIIVCGYYFLTNEVM